MHRLSAILLLTVALALPAGAAEIYRWTDGSGQVHFGATPPRGVDAEVVDVRVSRPASTPAEPEGAVTTTGGGGDAADGAPGEAVVPERDLAFERRQCETARDNLEVLRNGGTNRRFRDSDGNVVRYTEEQLAREIDRQEKIAAQYCQG